MKFLNSKFLGSLLFGLAVMSAPELSHAQTPTAPSCETKLSKLNFVIGREHWISNPKCQNGFGLCWLASALHYIETSLKLEGKEEDFSLEYLIYHYFRDRVLERVQDSSKDSTRSLADSGSQLYSGLDLILRHGLLPEKQWKHGTVFETGNNNPNRTAEFIAKLEIFSLLWAEALDQNSASYNDFIKGLDFLLQEQLGSYPEGFAYNDLKTATPLDVQERVLSPKLKRVLSTYKDRADSNTHATIMKTRFNLLHLDKLTGNRWLVETLKTSMITRKNPLAVSMRWNSLTLGSNAALFENIFDSTNITGLPPNLMNTTLSPKGLSLATERLDSAFIATLGTSRRLPGHAVLLVDLAIDAAGEITHVVLLNSHGKSSGYNGFHVVPITIFEKYVDEIWMLKEYF